MIQNIINVIFISETRRPIMPITSIILTFIELNFDICPLLVSGQEEVDWKWAEYDLFYFRNYFPYTVQFC